MKLAINSVKSDEENEANFRMGDPVLTFNWKMSLHFRLFLALQVLSLSVKGQSSQPLTNSNEILYRIYAAEPRIVPKTPLCLLWNPAAARYLLIIL